LKRATPHQWEFNAKELRKEHAQLNPVWNEEKEALAQRASEPSHE
jgi:hypothetical protein